MQIQRALRELQEKYDCHTVILYGSHARGDASPASDLDVIGFREEGPVLRDARLLDGFYLDAFIYPENTVIDPPDHMLDLRSGKVLCQKGELGVNLIKLLQARFEKGPKLWRADEIEAILTWMQKSMERIRAGGLAGDFRRVEILPVLLEDFFVIRGQWYLGPKASFQWLEKNRPDLHEAFASALKPGAAISAYENVVRLVTEAIQKEGMHA